MHRRHAQEVAGALGGARIQAVPPVAVGIGEVAFIRYHDATGDQHVAMWPPARDFVRRSTSATSPGEPEPVNGIHIAAGPQTG